MLGVRLFALGLLSFVVVGSALADPVSPWLAGPDAFGDDTYLGFVDAPVAGMSASAGAPIEVRGWVVDLTADGWAGIDQVQIFSGVMNQGGRKLADASIAQNRPDVAAALGNPFFAASGFASMLPAGALPPGRATLSVYIHSPSKGWWYRTVDVQVQAAAARPFSDDPLLVVETPLPEAFITPGTQNVSVHGFAIDRNADSGVGVGGSGVSHVQIYLDGGRRDGTFIGEAILGQRSREATGYGERFGTAGFEFTLHPSEMSEEPHALFIYAVSALPSGNETLVIVPIRILSR